MRLSLSKARKNLKQTGINASPETKFRTVIKGGDGFQISIGKLSIPALDAGEYELEAFAIEEGMEPDRLTAFSFEIANSDIAESEPEPETQSEPISLDPRDRIIAFLEKQLEEKEKNFLDRLTRELESNDSRWKARLDQKEFELKLEKENQKILEKERESISNRIEKNLRLETRYKTKPDNFGSIMQIIEKIIPFILPSGDSAAANDAMAKAKQLLESEFGATS